MKDIKAYVRPTVVEPVLRHLEEEGVRDIKVDKVDLDHLTDPEEARHYLLKKYLERYSTVSRLEMVCRDDEADRFVNAIRDVVARGLWFAFAGVYVTAHQNGGRIRSAS